MIKRMLLGVFMLVSLQYCGGTMVEIKLGDSIYFIPRNQIIFLENSDELKDFDSNSNMVSLTFSDDKELSSLNRVNAWLPKSPITALVHAKSIGTTSDLSTEFLKKLQASSIEKVEFDGFNRYFDKGINSSWMTIPAKNGDADIEQKLKFKCIALGGMDGITKSRSAQKIPTSCKVVFRYHDLIIRLSSSEENLIDSVSKIQKIIIKKFDLWKVKKT